MSHEIIPAPKQRKAIEGTIVHDGWIIDPFAKDLPKELRNWADLIGGGSLHGVVTRTDTCGGQIRIELVLQVKERL